MSSAPAALRRDLIAGAVPWGFYWTAAGLGHVALGAGLAVLALAGLRLRNRAEIKTFDLMVFFYFAVVAVNAGWLHAAVLDAWRPVLLPISLAAAAIGSIIVGRPCTLQYARQLVGPEWWRNRHFIHVNRILTAVWAATFLTVAAVTEAVTVVGDPTSIGERIAAAGLGFGLFAGAAWFSRTFPRWYRLNRYLPLVRAGREPYLADSPPRRP